MLEAERSKKDEKARFKSISAKYVPSSLNEIQAGFDLDIAKQSRVSFDPDVDYDDDSYENETHVKTKVTAPAAANNASDTNADKENEVGKKALNIYFKKKLPNAGNKSVVV